MIVYHIYRYAPGSVKAYSGMQIGYEKDTSQVDWFLPQVLPKESTGQFVKEYYPQGISRHGLYYLSPNMKNFRPDSVTENVFELVRQLNYSRMPSRFQSGFACPDLDTAYRWCELFCSYPREIWTVELSTPPLEFDSRFLQSFVGKDFSPALAVKSAHHYWQQDCTENPRLEVLLSLPFRLGKRIQSLPPQPNTHDVSASS